MGLYLDLLHRASGLFCDIQRAVVDRQTTDLRPCGGDMRYDFASRREYVYYTFCG
jgi:hypothetical protein